MKRFIKSSIAAVFAIMLIFCSEAHAAVTFTDISPSYWAKNDIAFAAEKGIVNGYPMANGTNIFIPENPVSYEEASAMLYRALNAAGMAKGQADGLEAKYADELNQAGIASWARKYVSYGLEYGIIDKSELSVFVDPATKLGRPAPRAVIAVWTAKALDKDFAGVYYLPYTDASQISDAAAPYIDMLYRHGIMKGSLMLDGSIAFQPGAGVKRSEFAAISNRVYNNAGASYDVNKETFSYKTGSGDFKESAKLRLADNAVTAGDSSRCVAVQGITAGRGGKPSVHFVSSPEVRKGVISDAVKLSQDKMRVDISSGNKNISYIFSSKTENTAKITKGTGITFIADGMYLIEVK